MLDFSRSRLKPFQHQREDVQRLIDHPYYFITSEMRTGKSKIVVDAAQFLYEAGVINRVIVVAPAPVRDVWYDPTLGEFAKHLWLDLPARVSEFHAKIRFWLHGPKSNDQLRIIVTNFEFLRHKNRLNQLLAYAGPKTLLVLDESSFVKTHNAQQTKSCLQLRRKCGRVVLLNGTPLFHSPLDLFSQGNILHPSILECPYVTHFKAKYAVMKPVRGQGGQPLKNKWNGKAIEVIESWTNLEDLQKRFAPYTVRRLQKECLDLPPKLDPVNLTATLSADAWRIYKEMRDELCVFLNSGDVAFSASAAVKVMRLSQITSGILGGIEDEDGTPSFTAKEPTVKIIGREKIDVLLWFLKQCFEREEKPKVVVWCRFRAEMFYALRIVQEAFPQFTFATIQGSQKHDERMRALALLNPKTSPDEPIFCIGIEGTGSFGLDMSASHTCVTLSSGYSPGRSSQTLDRVYGPGQTAPISYHNILAVGPAGQRTIDHTIAAARQQGHDIATWTSAAWVKALKEE